MRKLRKIIIKYSLLSRALCNDANSHIPGIVLDIPVFSSPEPKAPGELIVYAGSVVRRPSTISNDFSSETSGPIVTKFHMQPLGPLGMKSCSNGLGHMTKMAAMSMYVKNLKKSSSPEPTDR